MVEEPPSPTTTPGDLVEVSSRTVTLSNGKVVEVPQGISGISWVFGAWRGICHESEAQQALFYVRDLEFLRSAAFDSVPFEEFYLRPEIQEDMRASREEARKAFLSSIVLNPICTPEMLLEMTRRLKLDIEHKREERYTQIKASLGLDPIGSLAYNLRLALICNERTPEQALRLLAGDKNFTQLLSFLDNMIIPDHLPFGRLREDFFRYVLEEAEKKDEADQRKLLFVLAKCPHTPYEIRIASCNRLTQLVREAQKPVLDLLEENNLPADMREILMRSLD